MCYTRTFRFVWQAFCLRFKYTKYIYAMHACYIGRTVRIEIYAHEHQRFKPTPPPFHDLSTSCKRNTTSNFGESSLTIRIIATETFIYSAINPNKFTNDSTKFARQQNCLNAFGRYTWYYDCKQLHEKWASKQVHKCTMAHICGRAKFKWLDLAIKVFNFNSTNR